MRRRKAIAKAAAEKRWKSKGWELNSEYFSCVLAESGAFSVPHGDCVYAYPLNHRDMDALNAFLDDFDQITRTAHSRYRAYRPEDLIEHDSRAQAVCTYAHMVAEADRRFMGREKIQSIDVRGLKLWLFEEADAVIRWKKMDEDSLVRNYPTKQARDFDEGWNLPGLPMPPVRLTVGYLLDATGIEFIRTQIAKPAGRRRTIWNAAVFPREERKPGERVWYDATRQGHF